MATDYLTDEDVRELEQLVNPFNAVERVLRRCLPWRHCWRVSRVSVPVWDHRAAGLLKVCVRCPKVVAK